jgi:hypothetical protein
MVNLTPEKESEISKRIEQTLATKWKAIQKQLQGRDTSESKRNTLINILKDILLKVALEVLGKSRPPRNTPKKDPSSNTETAHRLFKRVGHVLKLTHTLYCDKNHAAPVNLDDTLIVEDSETLRSKGLTIPTNEAEWILWWPQRHTILYDNNDIQIREITSDKNFLKNSKETYKFCYKPKMTNKITSIRREGKIQTTDHQIEEELTNYVKRICTDENISQEAAVPGIPKRRMKNYERNENLQNFLTQPEKK